MHLLVGLHMLVDVDVRGIVDRVVLAAAKLAALVVVEEVAVVAVVKI